MKNVIAGASRLVGVLCTCAFVSSLVAANARADDLAAKALRYAERFMAGDFGALERDYTPDMKAAMTAAASAELRDALLARNGALVRTGPARYEDRIQVYTRYRVPLFFENATLDMRVVFDDQERVAGMFLVEHSEPAPAGGPPGVETEVNVGGDEAGLPGTLTLPRGSGPFPAVVLVHGSGPLDRDETVGPNKPFRDLAWGLARRGVASLRYDKRSFARPRDLLEAGEELTVREEVIDDALAGLALLKTRKEIDPDAVYVLGHSLGGAVAPRIAQEKPRPAGVIILAGSALPLPEKMMEQMRYIASLDGSISGEEQKRIDQTAAAVSRIRDALTGKSSVTGYQLGAPVGYYRDLESVDAPALLASLGLPCLVLQGGRDYQVTREDFRRWQEALAGKPGACLHVFDDLDHLFREGKGRSGPADYDVYKPVSPRVIDCTADWIKARRCCD